MNERIKELFVLAGGNPNWDKIDLLSEDRETVEKFAELIVKECANQCTTNGPFGAEVVWGKQFHKKIKEHFGVE